MKTALRIVLGLLLAVTIALTGWAVYEGGSDLSISANLVWGYALFALAIVGVVVAALVGAISNPAGLGKTLLGVVVVVAVVGTAFALALSHDATPVANSAGGAFENPFELRISEIGIYVTYIVAAIALLAVAVDLVSAVVRKFAK
jgi:hypothetical protein